MTRAIISPSIPFSSAIPTFLYSRQRKEKQNRIGDNDSSSSYMKLSTSDILNRTEIVERL